MLYLPIEKTLIMNKTYTQLWLIAAMLGVMCPAFSQNNYNIQLGAYTEKIDFSFFDFIGFNNVLHEVNSNQYHKYKWGNFQTPEAAEQHLMSLKKNVDKHGLNNLKIVPDLPDFTVVSVNKKGDKSTQSSGIQLFTRSVNFNNPKLSLKKTDIEVLEEVAYILEKNPTLKLRIFAPNANKKKKTRRRNNPPIPGHIIRNFLLAKNIPAYRIKTIEAKEVIAESTKPSSSVQQVLMTLVDLKEEIVLDKFGHDRFIAKEVMIERTLSSLD